MDQTNTGVPGAGNQLSGDVHRQAAIKRLKKVQAAESTGRPVTPPAPKVPAAPRGY